MDTQHTTDVVLFGCALANAVGEVMEDGQFELTELVDFIQPVTLLAPAIAGIGDVKDELMDLDDTERAGLHKLVQDKFDIPDDHVEQVVEKAIDATLALVQMTAMIAGKAPEPAGEE